jgi:hypothetical protein
LKRSNKLRKQHKDQNLNNKRWKIGDGKGLRQKHRKAQTPTRRAVKNHINHLGICLVVIPPLQKAPSIHEGVGSILGIFKIYVCVSLDYNFYHIYKKNIKKNHINQPTK